MKRFLICLMALALLLSATVVMTSAADYESDESILLATQLQPLYILSGSDIYSDLAEEYYQWWWEEEEGVEDSYFNAANINLRGFGMSSNGDYAYLGTLNGGDGLRGVVVLNTVTGALTDFYYHRDVYADSVPEPGHGPFSYAKGIDADTRGYVYVGFAFSNNYNVVNLGIARQEEDGTLTEISFTPVWEDGLHGDTSGTHVGVNGVDVITIGEKTYCYVVVNYDYDALYCFDVTDPANPVLNEEFGDGGIINFSDPNCPVYAEGQPVKELQYLDVDEDGTIYVVLNATTDTNGIMTIAPDGSACTNFYEVGGGNIYSVTMVGDYLLCGSKSGAEIFVVDKESGEALGSIVPMTDAYGDRLTRLVVRNDVLYVCDAGNDNSTFNAIYAGALSDSGLEYLRNVIKSLNGEFETETETETETDATTETETDAVTETDAATETDTDAATETDTDAATETEATTETAAGTTADTTADTTESATETAAETAAETAGDTTAETTGTSTEATGTVASTETEADEGGCASLLISGGSILALLAAAYIVSKRK